MALIVGYYDPVRGYIVTDASGVDHLASSAQAEAIRAAGGWSYVDEEAGPSPATPPDTPPTPGVAPPPPLLPQPDLRAIAGPDRPNSNDPANGGPGFTPGISFGQGQIPGSSTVVNQADRTTTTAPYHRQWFDVGGDPAKESLNIAYYNDPANWNFAWGKVLNQFGGSQGGNFHDWLQGFSSQARADYQNAVPYDPNLNVADFLDAYAPQLRGVYDLIPSGQKGIGGRIPSAGRSLY